MNVGVLIIDPGTHTITDANRCALEMIDASREQVLGCRCHGLVCTAETGACPVTDRGATLDVEECVLLSRSGRKIPILKSVRQIERQGKKVLIESFFNVEERQRAAEALRRSEEKFRIVADNTYDWEYWANPAGGFVYISPSCEKLTGYRAEDFESDPDLIYRIIHADDRERFREHRKEVRGTPRPEDEMEFRIVCRDGSEKWIAHVCQPVFDEEGRYLGARGSNRDITGRKAIEKERERLIGELKSALSKVKLLSGFLPICASCKKIRDDGGYWNQIESYLRDHSEAEFSHGICPDCARKLYPDYYRE
jgi:PAS domain S-box-containing protein